MPPQMSSSTFTPTALPTGPSLSHPPGYTQNTSALDMSASQRAVQERQESESGVFAGLSGGTLGAFGANNSSNNVGVLGSASGSGITGSGAGSSDGQGGGMGDAWNVAKQWIGTAAEKLEGVENEVWKRLNEKK